MNYIGSKYSLLNDIDIVLDEYGVPKDGIALDLFAGTGVVAQLLKLRGHIVYANDWQHYAFVTNMAFIKHNTFPTFKNLLADKFWQTEIKAVSVNSAITTHSINGRRPLNPNMPCAQVLKYLNQIPGKPGAFYNAYCDGGSAGRKYYATKNGLRIQAIRDTIESWSNHKLISAEEKAWLVACLIEAADRVANTASVYGAYLKHIKKTAQKPLALVALEPVASDHPADRHQVFCEDSGQLLSRLAPERLRLIYVDPPYNHRQYSANYHILETIARWDLDNFKPRGVTGLRNANEQRSGYSIRSAIEATFHQLFEQLHSEYLLFSYNNEGLLSKDKLLSLFERFYADVKVTEIEYNRFRADVDHENRVYKANHTQEYLIIGKRRMRKLY